MNVGLFGVLLLLLFPVIIMAMRQLVVVVFVGVPIGTMLPLFTRAVMMGEMIMLMAVDGGWVGVLGSVPLPFYLLLYYGWTPVEALG